MSESANLSPGSVVPKTGKYRCQFCGQGGLADLLSQRIGEFGGDRLAVVGRHSTVQRFEAGRTFPQCPTCGPATGWTLIDNARGKLNMPPSAEQRQELSQALIDDEEVPESGNCDICSRKVLKPQGYLLTTTQVVATAAYWQFYFKQHKSRLAELGVSSFSEFCCNPLARASCGAMIARQSTAWMVCDRCIEMFDVNRDLAESNARQWWDCERKYSPPGTGPAPLSAVDMGDGKTTLSSDAVHKLTQAPSSRATAPVARRATPQPLGPITRRWIAFHAVAYLLLIVLPFALIPFTPPPADNEIHGVLLAIIMLVTPAVFPVCLIPLLALLLHSGRINRWPRYAPPFFDSEDQVKSRLSGVLCQACRSNQVVRRTVKGSITSETSFTHAGPVTTKQTTIRWSELHICLRCTPCKCSVKSCDQPAHFIFSLSESEINPNDKFFCKHHGLLFEQYRVYGFCIRLFGIHACLTFFTTFLLIVASPPGAMGGFVIAVLYLLFDFSVICGLVVAQPNRLQQRTEPEYVRR